MSRITLITINTCTFNNIEDGAFDVIQANILESRFLENIFETKVVLANSKVSFGMAKSILH